MQSQIATLVVDNLVLPMRTTLQHLAAELTTSLRVIKRKNDTDINGNEAALCRAGDAGEYDWQVIARLLVMAVAFMLMLMVFRALYRIMLVPYERVRLLGSIGYLNQQAGQLSQKDVATLVRRRRKIGDNLPPVFPNGWFRLLDSTQLLPGQVKEVTAMGEHLAVFRSKSGNAHVLNAYCPHMGGNLAVGGAVVNDDCLQCPFHGWTFSGKDGTCVNIPYSEKVPSTAHTESWPCREVNGAIFVWYHCDKLAPQWEIPEIDEITSGKFHYRGRIEHHINTHIQDVPENGSDLAHLSHLHIPNVMSGADLSTMFHSWWNVIEHIFKVECRGPMPGKPHISMFYLWHYLLILKKFKVFHLDFKVYQIGPGMVHLHFTSSFGEGVFCQTLTAVEPLHLVLVHRLYTNWRIPTWAGSIMLCLEAIQVDRDVMVWNNKTYAARPLLVKQDNLIGKYRRWFAQFYSDNSPRLEDFSESSTSW